MKISGKKMKNNLEELPLEGKLIKKNPVSKKTMSGLTKGIKNLSDVSKVKTVVELSIGEFLTQAKEELRVKRLKNKSIMGWEEWVNQTLEVRFDSPRVAHRYMKMASLRNQVLMVREDNSQLPIEETIKQAQLIPEEDVIDYGKLDADKKAKSIANQMSSESKEWYTPDEIIESVFQVMGDIDLDPCSDPEGNVAAINSFTEEDDGLLQPWSGRVFMNPPYCGDSLDWCRKLISENPIESITLVASNTDTKFFHEMLDYCDAVCFKKGRLEFKPGEGNTGGNSNVRNVLFYKGQNVEQFEQQFSEIGSVLCL